MPIEKGIIHIKLANFAFAIECKTKHSMDGDRIYHVTKGLVKVNIWLLVKAFRNKPSFVHAIESSIFHLMRNTHLLPTRFCPDLGGTRA